MYWARGAETAKQLTPRWPRCWAAEAADSDILWSLCGPVEELKHHRGITHTLIGAPVVAGVVVGSIWLLDRWVQARRRRKLAAAKPVDPGAPGQKLPQPAHWAGFMRLP